MKPLQFQDIVGYLPHTLPRLKIQTKDGRICELEGLTGAWIVEARQGMRVTKEHIESIKPILRPLSDLTRGAGGAHTTQHKINLFLGLGEEYGDFLFSHYLNYLSVSAPPSDGVNRIYIPFSVFEDIRTELYKDHFDVNNLIVQGKAISIHDLK